MPFQTLSSRLSGLPGKPTPAHSLFSITRLKKVYAFFSENFQFSGMLLVLCTFPPAAPSPSSTVTDGRIHIFHSDNVWRHEHSPRHNLCAIECDGCNIDPIGQIVAQPEPGERLHSRESQVSLRPEHLFHAANIRRSRWQKPKQ